MKQLFTSLILILFFQLGFAQQDTVVQKEPEFPGGNVSLFSFLKTNSKLLLDSIEIFTALTVKLSFMVDTTGSISGTKITSSVCDLLDSEAISLVNKMPRWNPATLNGKKIIDRYTLSIRFDRNAYFECLSDSEKVFSMTAVMPEFHGGEAALVKYIQSKAKTHSDSKQKNLHGTVYLTFVVTRGGDVKDVRVLRGINPELDKLAISIISTTPKWKPGTQNGHPVNVQYNYPIKFE